jgi:hypothetical protein
MIDLRAALKEACDIIADEAQRYELGPTRTMLYAKSDRLRALADAPLCVAEALRDPRVRAGTHKAVVLGCLIISVVGGVLLESRCHDDARSRHDNVWWSSPRPAQLGLDDLDAVCEVRPVDGMTVPYVLGTRRPAEDVTP